MAVLFSATVPLGASNSDRRALRTFKGYYHGSWKMDGVVSENSITTQIAEVQAVAGSAGAVFGLYFYLKRPQDRSMDAMRMILLIMAGWMNRQQQHVIDYLQEEIRTLKELLEQQSDKRPRFTDAQRSRLARKAKRIP